MQRTPLADSSITRRRLIAGVGGCAAGTGLLVSQMGASTAASVEMDNLNVSGDAGEFDAPPAKLTVTVDGALSMEGDPPEQSVAILGIRYDGTEFSLDHEIFQNSPSEATFTLSGNVFDWRGLSPGDVFPDHPGASDTASFVVRLKAQAFEGNELVAEDVVEDTASVELTNAGKVIQTGGSGSMNVTAE